jgi:hypothetical protein
MARKVNFIIGLTYLASFTAYGQNGFNISVPVIYSNVEIKDNWTPPTAINYKEYLSGTSLGYGLNMNYSFRPTFIIKDNRFLLNVGVGYFQQHFDISRPFDYNSALFIIYYTDHYSYHCLNLSAGLTYNLPLGEKYSLTGNLSYSQQSSFRQDYTPTYSPPNRGFDGFTQTNTTQIDFGKMLNLSVGINRNLGDRFSIGLNVLIPVYVRWRNDKIFKDDPSTFYSPKFSLGTSISIAYTLKKKQ